MQEAGAVAREVTLAQPTLDDVFLRATGRLLEVDAPAGYPRVEGDVPAPVSGHGAGSAGEEDAR